jgi:hypothetical protein
VAAESNHPFLLSGSPAVLALVDFFGRRGKAIKEADGKSCLYSQPHYISVPISRIAVWTVRYLYRLSSRNKDFEGFKSNKLKPR